MIHGPYGCHDCAYMDDLNRFLVCDDAVFTP